MRNDYILKITTDYLDILNDYIDIFLTNEKGVMFFTDDGSTISISKLYGFDKEFFESEPIKNILKNNDSFINGDEIKSPAKNESNTIKISKFGQLIKSINEAMELIIIDEVNEKTNSKQIGLYK